MSRGKHQTTDLDRARDELFSHIRRCGVLEAEDEQRTEWLKDTIHYLAERYPELSQQDQAALNDMGERYCGPAIRHGNASDAAEEESDAAEEESDAAEEVSDAAEEVSDAAEEASDAETNEVSAA